MSPLPDYYPATVDLPFNSTCLAGRFTLEPPVAARAGEGYWLLIMAGELLLREDAAGLHLPRGATLPTEIIAAAPPLHIGVWDGLPCRVAPISRDFSLPAGWVRESFSAAAPHLSIELVSLAALAQQLLRWEKKTRYCGTCGGTLTRSAGSWGKGCPDCQAVRFPAIHPCVIVLIHRPGELLLVRKAEWAAGRYGLVAGFLDFGEALEEAVIREVREETGVTIKNIRYIGSQAWPFPSQLMAGFIAEYAAGELCVDRHELEDARWFPLDALPELPPPRSIARYLLNQHLGHGKIVGAVHEPPCCPITKSQAGNS
jgi:NAD+ diphosphatase